jgi:hypothetical protein
MYLELKSSERSSTPYDANLILALSIGPNWVGFTWGRRQNPISETLYFVNILDKDETMDNVQNYNIWRN